MMDPRLVAPFASSPWWPMNVLTESGWLTTRYTNGSTIRINHSGVVQSWSFDSTFIR